MREFLQRRAGFLIVASWAVSVYVWYTQTHLISKLEFWVYCYPLSDLADAWRLQSQAIPVVKAAILCLPVVPTAFFPHHRFQAGRAAALVILAALLVWILFAAWIASSAYPS